jgi:hypothetical protein
MTNEFLAGSRLHQTQSKSLTILSSPACAITLDALNSGTAGPYHLFLGRTMLMTSTFSSRYDLIFA